MNDPVLPYLKSLKSTFDLLAAQPAEGSVAMQVAVSRRLVDLLIAQRSSLPTFKAEATAAFAEKLGDIEAEIAQHPASAKVVAVLQKLRTLLGAAPGETGFPRLLQLAGELQHCLLEIGTPRAAALCTDILRIEADYCEKFRAAVANPAESSTQSDSKPDGPRRAKAYTPNKLTAFLREAYPQEIGLTVVRCDFTSGGFSKLTLDLELSGVRDLPGHVILRSDAANIYSGDSVTLEHRLFKVLHEHGVRVPRPLALEDSGKLFGAPFMVMEKAPGKVIGNMIQLPGRNLAVCRDVAAQLATIHRVPLEPLAQCFAAVPARTSDRILALIEQDIAAWLQLDLHSAVYETAFDWLRRHAWINDKGPRALVHGDYGMHNILIENDRVTAVLDWEFPYIGCPAYDLGFFYGEANALASWDEFLQAYADSGMPLPDKDQLDYNILFALVRLGVISSRMYRQFVSGNDTGIGAAWMISENLYETYVTRIAKALERVL